MIIDNELLDELTAQAKANPRLRQSYDLRNSSQDKSQRMLNALEPGTIMPIHRHRSTNETMTIIRGELIERFYDDDGLLTEEYLMTPEGGDGISIVNIPKGKWHSLEVTKSGTIILEAKDGSYQPLQSYDIMDLSNIPPAKVDKEAYILYQELCDKIFDTGAISIKPERSNNVIGTLTKPRDFAPFIHNFEQRLIRLRDRFKTTKSYPDLLEAVKQVANPHNWDGAYAELVAYDVMYNDYLPGELELNVTLPADRSYAGDLGGKETNQDGYISEYYLFFDVKALTDTTGIILDGIIQEASNKAGVNDKCNVMAEYPPVDIEEEYRQNRRQLMQELQDFLVKNVPTELKGKSHFTSNIIQRLSYRILWGSGVNSTTGVYGPYEHAENCRHIIFQRYMKTFMKHDKSMIVLVNFPWYNHRINNFSDGDEWFYRSLARRTFCAYKHLPEPMNAIVAKYKGTETIHEVSQHLSAIMYIDDHSIDSDTYSCHLYINPNAVNKIDYGLSYLKQVVQKADSHSLVDNLQNDNY